MAASANRMKLKNTPMDIWSTRERLCLGSSVMRSGDQNWVSVSRAIKPFGETNRPADWFSQKNCARQYADLLEKVETPKRKRGERGEIETPGESIVRKLTLERIEELKKIIQQEQQQYHKLRTEIDMIQSGHFDDKLEELWQQVLDEKKKEDQAVLDHQKWLQDREVAIATAPKSKMPTTPISKQRKPVKPPRSGVMRRNSSQSEPGSEAESTSNSPLHEALEVDIPSIAPKPPQPTSPLLTSLLKSPTAASKSPTGFSILHSAITQPKEGGRVPPATSTATSAISTLLSSSPGKSGLLASAFNLDPEIPTRPPTTSPSAGAPTLSRLLEMPLASPGKPLPPLPVVTPETEQSPPIEATPDSSTDTVVKQEDVVEQEQTEVTSTCIPVSSESIEEETVPSDPSDNVVTEVTVMDEPEQIPVVSESVVVTDNSSAEAEPAESVQDDSVSEVTEVPVETEPDHIPEEANSSLGDVKVETAEEVVVEETASVEIKEEPETTSGTEVEIHDEDLQVIQEELVEAVEEEETEIVKEESVKVEEQVVEEDTSLSQTPDEVEVKPEEIETSQVSPDETPKPSSPVKEEPEPDSEPEARSETPSSVKEQPVASKTSEPTRGRGRGRGRGRRSFPTRTLHHSGSNDSKPKDSPKPDSDEESDEENEEEAPAPKKATESVKAREKTPKGKDDSESKERDDRKSAKKEDGRSTRRDEAKNRKDDAKGKKAEAKEDGKGKKEEGRGKKADGKEESKGRKSDAKEDGKGKKLEGKEDMRRRKSDGKEDSKGKKSDGKEDSKGKKSDGKEDSKGKKSEGKDESKVKKADGKEDGKGKKKDGKETTDDERSRSRKRSNKDDDDKDGKVAKKEEPAKEKKVDGRRRKTLPTTAESSATQDEPKLASKVAEDKEEKEAVSSDKEDTPEPEPPKVSRRGKERKIEREESLPDTDDDKFSERDESSNLSKPLFPSDSIPNSPASNAQSDDHEGLRDYKVWKKAIMLVWRSAATHKFANVFLHPVTEEVAPGYKVVVYRPMDLSQIKKNIENGVIKTTAEFQRDMMLMFQNAIMYNSSDHDVYTMAVEMQKEVMCHIQDFLATQLMVQTAEIPKTLRRETRELAQKRTSESFSDIKQMDDSKRSGSESEGSKPKKRRMRTADD